jgi:ABC-type nitrate/sulfonate/bicarbonate transport system substrate-binding protein
VTSSTPTLAAGPIPMGRLRRVTISRICSRPKTRPLQPRQHGSVPRRWVVPPLWAYARGACTRLVAIGQEEGFRGLIVRADSDIVEPRDLRGKRIAIPNQSCQLLDFARAISWRGAVECLQRAGLKESDVVFVDAELSEPIVTGAATSADGSTLTVRDRVSIQTAEVFALVRGEADAIFTAGGYGLEVAALIDARVVLELSERDPWPSWQGNHLRILTVSEELCRRRPDLVGRYLAALQRASSWAKENECDALRIVAAEIGLAEEWARLGYHPDTVRHLNLERSDDALERLHQWAVFLAERGFIGRPVDVAEWLAPELDLVTSLHA